MSDRILTLHPDPTKSGVNIGRAKYEAFREALLRVVPSDGDGVLFGELSQLVEPLIPEQIRTRSSISWYVATVKLDLEARGEIERIPGSSPQRLRRVAG